MTAPVHPHTGFTLAEYERRWQAVEARFETAGIDALLVTTKTHLEYLTGHDANGAYAAPYVLIVAPGRPRVCVVRAYDVASVRPEVVGVELRTYFGRHDAMQLAADSLRSLGLDGARLGVELDCWGLAPMDLRRLEAAVPNATLVDASRLLQSVADRKGAEEIAAMRQAMRHTETAIAAFWASIREGVSEVEATHAVRAAVEAEGSDTRELNLLFGPRTALPHGKPTSYRLRPGDPAFIEVSGHVSGYAAGLCRTAVLGRNPRAEALHLVAEDCTAAAIEALRPGATGEQVHAAVRAVVDRAGRGTTMTQRTGYAIGINWYDRGYMSLEPGAVEPIEPSMTFHMPRILFDESGEFGIGTSETVLITDTGAEVLSHVPGGIRLA